MAMLRVCRESASKRPGGIRSVLFALTSVGFIFGAGVRFFGAESEPPSKPSGGALPPLQVDRKMAPRLEEIPEKPSKTPSQDTLKKRADNSACYVCHGNYQEESLALVHRDANVGCVDCHGQSLGHRNAEDHLTPPEIMYPAEKIEAACKACHETHDAPAKKVLARWQAKCPTKTDPEQLVCTDCHGEHRLVRREIVWDKRTGKVVPSKISPSPSPTQ